MAVRLRASRRSQPARSQGETAAAIIHPAICATRRLRRYCSSFNCAPGHVARGAHIKYAEASSPSEADHPVSKDSDGVRLSEEQRLDWLSPDLDLIEALGRLSQRCRVHAATTAASIFFIASRSASGSSNKWP